jgi:hypothetical protein
MPPTAYQLSRLASHGPAAMPEILRVLGGTAPSGDATSLTTGVPAASYPAGTYAFRTQILARRVQPTVAQSNVAGTMGAFLRLTTGGRVTVDRAVLSVGARESAILSGAEAAVDGGNPYEDQWWLTLDGTVTATGAFSLAEINTAVAESVTTGLRWGAAPGMTAPTDPSLLRGVLSQSTACSGGVVRRAGVPWLRACTRLMPVAPAAPGPCVLGLGAQTTLRTRPDPSATGPTVPQGAEVTFLARTGARYGAAVFYRVNYRGTVGYIALDPSAFAPTHCISRLPMEPVAAPESWNAIDPLRPPAPAPPPTQTTSPSTADCTVTLRDVGYLRPSATFDRTGARIVATGSRVIVLANTGLTEGPWTLYNVRVATGPETGRVGYIGLSAADLSTAQQAGCLGRVPRVMAPIPAPPTAPAQPLPTVPAPAPPPMVPTPTVRVPPLLPAPPPMPTVTPPAPTQSAPVWPWLLGVAAVAVTAAVVVRNT